MVCSLSGNLAHWILVWQHTLSAGKSSIIFQLGLLKKSKHHKTKYNENHHINLFDRSNEAF